MHEDVARHEVVCAIFDSFCKTVLRNKARNLAREKSRHAKSEYSVGKAAAELPYTDQYPSDENQIVVAELVCCIQNDHLYEALLHVPHRELILLILHFWENWPDQRIADRFLVSTRTIRKWRRNSLIRLRNILIEKGWRNYAGERR